MITIKKQQAETIIKDIFKSSICDDAAAPISFGFKHGNPTIFVATKHVDTDLKHIQQVIIYKILLNDIDVVNVGVSPMPDINCYLKYSIEVSPNYQFID